MAQLDAVTLVITPQRQQHIGHYHHQRRALRQLLVQAKQHAQRRNRDQPTANAEQATHGPQGCAQHDIQQPFDHQGLIRLYTQCEHANECGLAGKRIAAHNGYAFFAKARQP